MSSKYIWIYSYLVIYLLIQQVLSGISDVLGILLVAGIGYSSDQSSYCETV